MAKKVMIVTEDDRILCVECYREGLDEQDPGTHIHAFVGQGVCDSCGWIAIEPEQGECDAEKR